LILDFDGLNVTPILGIARGAGLAREPQNFRMLRRFADSMLLALGEGEDCADEGYLDSVSKGQQSESRLIAKAKSQEQKKSR
jgi:hypothetical protein